MERNLFELEESLSKKYYDHDDPEYQGIKGIGHLFNQSFDKDYYKPIGTDSAFNGNYVEYESKGDEKNYCLKNILIWSNHV